MNTERLYDIAKAIINDINTTAIQDKLSNLTSQIEKRVKSSVSASHQEGINKIISDIGKVSESAPSNDFSATMRQAVTKLIGEGVLGYEMDAIIEKISTYQQFAPSVALVQIKELINRIQQIKDNFAQLINTFKDLGIDTDNSKHGICELEVLIPRSSFKNKLDKLGEELSELNTIFNVFAEIATGSRPGFDIRNLSSSDPTVLLDLKPEIAACIAVAVERIVTLYKKLLEIRKLHNDLKKSEIPKKTLKDVDDHANSIMNEGIKELISKLIKQFYKKTDDGRENELTTELRFTLNKIAGRIDRGYNIEIRIKPVQENETEDTDEVLSHAAQYIQTIKSAKQNMQFIKEEGEPILNLPESKSNIEEKKNE